MPQLDKIAAMPENWDGEGSPAPSPRIVAAAKGLFLRVRCRVPPALDAPFVSPIGGGGLQLEWTRSGKHLELEFLDERTICFLKEETVSGEDRMESGEYLVADTTETQELLNWFAAP